jgi:ribosomal protein S18 acetylase RimI-like enzyme
VTTETKPRLTIRPMRRQNAKAVAKMMGGLQEFHGDKSLTKPQHFIDYCLGPRRLCRAWIAYAGKSPAGFAITSDRMNFVHAKPDRTLNLLYVEEAYRHSGIGSALIARVADDSIKQGFMRLNISASPSNRIANLAYRKLGFILNPRRQNKYKIEDSALRQLAKKTK